MDCISASDLFHGQGAFHSASPYPAVLVRQGQAKEAEIRHTSDGGVRKLARLVVLRGDGHDLLLGKLSDCSAEEVLIIREAKRVFK
jgi:hypothetical protein